MVLTDKFVGYDIPPDPDYPEDHEQPANPVTLYTTDFSPALKFCDKRVVFTDTEKNRLSDINDELLTLLGQAKKYIEICVGDRITFEQLPAHSLYKKLVNIKLRIEKLENSSKIIQTRAEQRLMRTLFGDDINSVVTDAMRIIEIEEYNRLPYLDTDFLFGTTTQIKLKGFISAFLHLVPMHVHYLVKKNQLDVLMLSLDLKLKDYFKNDNEFLANLDNVEKVVIDEIYKIDLALFTNILEHEMILQAPPLAYLSMLSTKRELNVSIDRQYKTALLQLKGLEVFIENYVDENNKVIHELDIATLQLIDMILIEYNKKGRNSQEISLSVFEYMKMRDLSVEQKAREQIKKAIDNIYSLRLNYNGSDKNKDKYKFKRLKIITDAKFRKKHVNITLDPTFCSIIKDYKVMKYPKALFTFSEISNPNSYYLLKRIIWHHNINYNHLNSNIISVETLLNACPKIPKYQEISETGQIRQRLIIPFERDMNALSDVLDWEYWSSNGKLDIGDKDMTYDKFASLKIKFNWVYDL